MVNPPSTPYERALIRPDREATPPASASGDSPACAVRRRHTVTPAIASRITPMETRTAPSSANIRNTVPVTTPAPTAGNSRHSVGQCACRR
ncbi:hypothetical protein SFUMM280S_07061 [Streptomyces fumanus]